MSIALLNEVQALKERVAALEELVRKLAADVAPRPVLALNGEKRGETKRQ